MAEPRLTWEEGKHLSSQREHGLSLGGATRVHLDPNHAGPTSGSNHSFDAISSSF